MAKKSVLIIDDEEWLAEQYAHHLERAGFGVSRASNALEGIEAIDEWKPRAIILDIFMPGPNGLVLLHELRTHSDLKDIPVVICSNSASDISHDNLTKYGVRAVLDKASMHPEDIVTTVRKVLA